MIVATFKSHVRLTGLVQLIGAVTEPSLSSMASGCPVHL
jgi:hypothetical protein